MLFPHIIYEYDKIQISNIETNYLLIYYKKIVLEGVNEITVSAQRKFLFIFNVVCNTVLHLLVYTMRFVALPSLYKINRSVTGINKSKSRQSAFHHSVFLYSLKPRPRRRSYVTVTLRYRKVITNYSHCTEIMLKCCVAPSCNLRPYKYGRTACKPHCRLTLFQQKFK